MSTCKRLPAKDKRKIINLERNLLLFEIIFPKLALGKIALVVWLGLSHLFALLKLHYQELIQCIEDASLSPCEAFCANIPSDIISNIAKYIVSNYSSEQRSKRAAQLREIHDFEGIVRKLWPNMMYVSSSVSGAFQVFEKDIRYHLGNVPLLGAIYVK
mmetsp:Transcript_122215/g.182569  ORF Transcript_122215/g.182569 Transcript_122215/m.182569 type:complete len:158 (-) Transcript_122215:604-1077(-)